jgi:hypothetical protein
MPASKLTARRLRRFKPEGFFIFLIRTPKLVQLSKEKLTCACDSSPSAVQAPPTHTHMLDGVVSNNADLLDRTGYELQRA